MPYLGVMQVETEVDRISIGYNVARQIVVRPADGWRRGRGFLRRSMATTAFRNRITELFADAREMHARAIVCLEHDDIRDAAEKGLVRRQARH